MKKVRREKYFLVVFLIFFAIDAFIMCFVFTPPYSTCNGETYLTLAVIFLTPPSIYLIIFITKSIKYDDKCIYFYEFSKLIRTIKMQDILSLQIIIIHCENQRLKMTLRNGAGTVTIKFGIMNQDKRDIGAMLYFIKKHYPDVIILDEKYSLF